MTERCNIGHRYTNGYRVEMKDAPSKAKIAEFWFRWGRWKELHHEAVPLFVVYLMSHLGLPTCWACYEPMEEYQMWGWRVKPALSNWNKVPLERAHVIPRSLGGSNRLRNLVLLCQKCHADAPDSTNAQLMLTWLEERERVIGERREREVLEALATFGFTDDVSLMKANAMLLGPTKSEVVSYITANTTTHFGTASAASFIAALKTYMQNNPTQVQIAVDWWQKQDREWGGHDE